MRIHYFVLFCLISALSAAADPARWRDLRATAERANKADDCVALRTALTELAPLAPNNPRNIYNLAACNSRLGQRDAALGGLATLAHMGLVYNIAADADFSSLLKSRAFQASAARMTRNGQPVTQASSVFSLAGTDLIPESIAYDALRHRWFIGSVRQAKIVSADGKLFARTQWSVFALAIDSRRRILWATIAAVAQCAVCNDAAQDRSALLGFDLDSGAEQLRIDSPVNGVLGDMSIAPDGDLYVSEGMHGAVLRLPQGARAFERLDDPGEFLSPQTPALSADGRVLYVPDYVRGIAAITLESRQLRWLRPGPHIVLTGIDGLYIDHGSFIAVQNGVTPERIVRISADLQTQTVLEANWPGLGEPTHGVIVGRDFYFLANTGWNAFDEQGSKLPGVAPVESAVWSLPL
jgi:sugar lactone lactonase YvrE